MDGNHMDELSETASGRGGKAGEETSSATPPNAQAQGLRVVEFQQLDTSFAVSPADEEHERRRLMTLLASPAPHTGRLSQSEVMKAANTEGEAFALKRLLPLPTDQDPTARRGREAALFEEYRNLVAVSHLQGFPHVLGYGITREGEPAILMEWVEGLTLHDALAKGLLPAAPGGQEGVDGVAVASLALSVLRALVSTSYLEGTFAHRDISPRNIMLRTDAGMPATASWGIQAPLDCCLIDLGSAIFMRRDEATFTMTMDVWRNATPEYAPPEMLALSDRSYLEARRSPAIDTYALCSVLYEAYCGHTPFRLADHPGESAYDLKAAGLPDEPTLHDGRDKPLVKVIMAGLAPAQADRPAAHDLFDAIASWRTQVTGQTTDRPGAVPQERAEGAHLTIATAGEARNVVPRSQDGGASESIGQHAQQGTSAPRKSVSRRGLVIGTACAAAAVVAGGVWWRQATPEGRTQDFQDLDWDGLANLAARLSATGSRDEALPQAVAAGIAQEDGSMVDGLTRLVSLADGTQATVQLVDFCHDDRADGQGKAGLTFAFIEPVTARPMAEAVMAQGGWDQCDMRAWLGIDFRNLLPDDLASCLTPVTKLTNNAGATRDAASVTATEDTIWLFSMRELGGEFLTANFSADYQYLEPILNAEGSQYRLWQDKRTAPKSENPCLQRTWQGQPCLWWNRSPSPDCSEDNGQTWFNRVGTNGDVFHFACAATGDGKTAAVLPGFCL